MTHPTTHPIVWVHGDALSPHNPALHTHPEAPALFVWDEALLAQWHISLKRMVFMYECLLELPVVIRRGDVVAELCAFAAEQDTSQVVTVQSVSPRFAVLCQQLASAGLQVTVLPVEPFTAVADYDLKRFSRYWRKAKQSALQPSSI